MSTFHHRWSKKVTVVVEDDAGQGGVAACLQWHNTPPSRTVSIPVTKERSVIEPVSKAQVTVRRPAIEETKWTKYDVSNCKNTEIFELPPEDGESVLGTGRVPQSISNTYRSCAEGNSGLNSYQATARNKEEFETEKLRRLRHLYERELQLQLEREAFKGEKMKEYEDYLRQQPSVTNLAVDEKQLEQVLRGCSRKDATFRPMSGRFGNPSTLSGRPPLPFRRAHSAKCAREVAVVDNYDDPNLQKQNLRITRPSSALPPKPWQRGHQNFTTNAYKKHVGFNLPESKSRLAYPEFKQPLIPKNGAAHFFEWRNMSTKYAPSPAPDFWKLSKYAEGSKRRPYSGSQKGRKSNSAKSDGSVNVQLNCPEDEQVNVTLQVKRAPSRVY